MDDFPDMGRRGSPQKIFGSLDIGFVDFPTMPDSKPVNAGDMIDYFNARAGLFERVGIKKIPRPDFNGIGKKRPGFLRTAGQDPDRLPG